MGSKSTKLYVDSINNDICRLLLGDGPRCVNLPLNCLPDGTQEGDMLRMTMVQMSRERELAKKDVKKLLTSLGNDLKSDL